MARDYGRDRYGWNWRGPKRALQKRVTVPIDGSVSDIDEFVDALREASADVLDPELKFSWDRDGDVGVVVEVTGWKWATTADIGFAETGRQSALNARAVSEALQVDRAKRTLEQLAPDLLRRDGD